MSSTTDRPSPPKESFDSTKVGRGCNSMFNEMKRSIESNFEISINQKNWNNFISFLASHYVINSNGETGVSTSDATKKPEDENPESITFFLGELLKKWFRYCSEKYHYRNLSKIERSDDEMRITVFLAEYKRFSIINLLTSRLYSKLDSGRSNRSPKLLIHRGVRHFFDVLLSSGSVFKNLCEYINSYRNEEFSSKAKIQEMVHLLINSDRKLFAKEIVSEDDSSNKKPEIPEEKWYDKFEAIFFRRTRAFYKNLSSSMLERCSSDISLYFDKCGFYLRLEEDLNRECLHSRSLEMTRKIFIQELISKNVGLIMGEFSRELKEFSFDRKNLSIRKRLGNYFSIANLASHFDAECEVLEDLSQTFGETIKFEAEAKLETLKTAPEMILYLIETYFFYRDQLTTIFADEKSPDKIEVKGSSQLFCTQFIRTFDRILAERIQLGEEKIPAAEILSLFCDAFQSGSSSIDLSTYGLSIELVHEGIISLLMRISDKDFFAEEYSKNLSKRLLDKDPDEQKERDLISVIKGSLGAGYTHKFEVMLQDRNTSQEVCGAFSSFCTQTGIKLEVPDFKALVLTSGCWPRFSTENLPLPKEVGSCIDSFKMFYSSKFGNRVLAWAMESSKATLISFFGKKKIEMTMSAYQALACLLFNQYESLTVEEMANYTGIKINDLKNAIAGLSLGNKAKILRLARDKDGDKIKKIENNDLISFNSEFAPKSLKISIPTPKKAVQRTKTGVSVSCEEGRKYVYDATIVRIMKARKSLKLQEIVLETLSQINLFRGDPKAIKTRVEDLIMREFIRRDESESSLFHYVA